MTSPRKVYQLRLAVARQGEDVASLHAMQSARPLKPPPLALVDGQHVSAAQLEAARYQRQHTH